jgi:NAD+ kinase
MKVGIFGSSHQGEKQALIRRLFEKLALLEAEVYVEGGFYEVLSDELHLCPRVAGLLEGDLFDIDMAFSVGGDGSFLKTAARVNRQGIPILGINAGRLGFLADIGGGELDEALEEIFKNYYRIEERSLLCLDTQGQPFVGYKYALNEVAVLKRDTSSMLTIHASLDDHFLASYQADGLIIATPTGSTAYSMSVNGPIIVPQSNTFVLSPVAPHSLNVRPLVIPDSSVIALTIESRSEYFLVALDGRSEVLQADTKLRISKADFCTRVMKRYKHTFYETLRDKLMWGADVRSL